jgi:hypothetical protein
MNPTIKVDARGCPYLPYGPGKESLEACRKRWAEVRANNEKPVEVNCFGTKKYELGRLYVDSLATDEVGKLNGLIHVRVYNDKISHWMEEDAIQYPELCPVDGKFMLVRAIRGTTWIACCGEKCYAVWMEYHKIWEEWINRPPEKRITCA